MPDAMSENPIVASIDSFGADEFYTIGDENNAVEVYPLANTHAQDMSIIYVPSIGAVFVSDIYSPNPAAESAGAGGQLIADAIEAYGLDVSLIVGGHGATIDAETFEGILGQ
jgi:hypothetical protein